MTSDAARTDRPGARVNLRMWSNDVSFHSAADRIALAPIIVGVKGEPRVGRKGEQLCPARRHYLSLSESKLYDSSELDACVNAFLSALELSAYAAGTKARAIEATVWIAIFDDNFEYQDAIGEATIARARDLGVKLFIDDFTRQASDGAPLAIWLT